MLFNGRVLSISDDVRHLEKLRDEEIEKSISDEEETPRRSKSGRISVHSPGSGSGRISANSPGLGTMPVSSPGLGKISVNSSGLRTPSSVNGKQEPALELTPNFQSILGQLLQAISPGCSTQGKSKGQGLFTPVPVSNDNVKIGKALVVSTSCFMEAKAAKSGSEMTMALVRGSFSMKRLRRSSYAGQKRVIDGVTHQKPSLKKYTKMRDIRAFALTRFPGLSQSSFGAAVNSVTGKKAMKRKQPQLVEESEESDDMETDME